jgi:hypothetical protein
VAETLTDDNTSTKGITTGMSSSDARDVLVHREYYGAIKAVAGAGKGATPAQQPLLLDIEAYDGQPITIHAKRFKIYAPPAAAEKPAPVVIAEPKQKKSVIKEISEEGRAWFRDAVVPWKSIDENSETQRLIITTDAITQRFETAEQNQLIRDVAGTRNDPAALDRAEADKIRAEADRIRATATPAATP